MSDEANPTDLMQQRAFELLQLHARKASSDTEASIREFYDQSAAHAAALTHAQTLLDIAPTLRQAEPGLWNTLRLWVDLRWARWIEPQETWKLAVAVPVVLLCLFAFPFLLTQKEVRETTASRTAPPIEYTTQWRQAREFVLSDGSRAWLDWQTSISESFSSSLRSVTVHRGKAVFDVLTDPARPFVVQAGVVTTEVTGTEFTVNFLTDSDIEIAVIEGQVRVATADMASTTLNAAEVVLARGTELGEVSSRSSEDMLRWREGLLVYRERPLADVLNELAAYTPFSIDLTHLKGSDSRVSGVFYKNQAQDALLTVLESQNLAFAQSSNQLIIKARSNF